MNYLADEIYGGHPAGNVAALPLASGAVDAGKAVPSPDVGAAPLAASMPASVGDLMNDPTFWLVATVAAVAVLAGASRSRSA